MRRRLTLAMVAMVFGALILSGLVSLGVAAQSSRNQTRKELVREAQELSVSVQTQAEADNKTDPAKALRNLLTALKSTLSVNGSAVVGVRADGQFFSFPVNGGAATLPAGLSASDLDPTALYQLQTVSGTKGRLVFAAAPYRADVPVLGVDRQVVLVVVLTSEPPSVFASAGAWFFLSSLVILLAAWLVAARLGRRFVRPIQAAQEATSRIAAGDLDARIPEPHGADSELAALTESINSMASRLAEAKGAERQFLQSVSHDLRTPLTSIRGFAEAIEDGAAVDVQGAARVIASESRRLERLVGDLLGLATVEARRFTLQPQALDLSAAVAETAAGFGPAAADLGLAIVVVPSASGPVGATADPDRLAQVVANLIENALRFATREVRVQTRTHYGAAELCVEDDGPGIAPEYLARVFERLFVARPRPDRPIGSGLGLTIVSGLVSAMGGSAHAESPIGSYGGTRMVVSLPPAGILAYQTNESGANRPPSTGAESTPITRSSTVAYTDRKSTL